jgi:hypothetical protein
MQKAKRLFITALFGSIIFVTRVFVPAPIDKLLIVVDAVLLALASLFIKKAGATQVGAIGGVLAGLWRPSVPFSFLLVFLYGVLVDLLFMLLKVKTTADGVKPNRLIIGLALSTLVIALLSYYATVLGLMIITANPLLDLLVAFMGPVSGAVAGYATAYLWNRYLKNVSLAL